MRLWIDGRAACANLRTGKGQWVLQTIAELLKTTPLTILTDGHSLPESWRRESAAIRVLPPGLWWHGAALRMLLKERPDAYIAPSSFIVPAFLPRAIRTFPIVHDLIAWQSGPHEWKARWIERLTLGRAVTRATHVCVISNSTKEDLLRQFPCLRAENVSTIFAGALDSHPARNIPDHRTILCPGTLCPRKNQLRLLQAYALLPIDLRTRYRLLLVGGRGWQDDAIVALAAATPGAEWRGFVPEEEYRALLSTCTMLAFPSLYEGFGLPVLDALQRGIPVLTTDRGSLPEVAGNCAIAVDPLSVESIRSGLLRMLTDSDLLATMRECGLAQAEKFSWKRTADLLLSAVQSHRARVSPYRRNGEVGFGR